MFGNRSDLFGGWGYLQHRWVGPAFRNTHTQICHLRLSTVHCLKWLLSVCCGPSVFGRFAKVPTWTSQLDKVNLCQFVLSLSQIVNTKDCIRRSQPLTNLLNVFRTWNGRYPSYKLYLYMRIHICSLWYVHVPLSQNSDKKNGRLAASWMPRWGWFWYPIRLTFSCLASTLA